MKNDEVEIDARIAELEAEIAILRARRASSSNAKNWNPASAENEGDPFILQSATDLTFAALPDLARLVLDALPVQVFLKYSAITSTLGRKYLYLNRPAREALNWNEDKVTESYDRQAFPSHPQGFDLFQEMQRQESETLERGKSRTTTLDWTPRGGGWHRNTTLEVPILAPVWSEDGTSYSLETLGFCAIGQDMELPKQLAIFLQMFHHHYRNLTNSLGAPLRRISKAVGEMRVDSARASSVYSIVEAELTAIKQRLSVSDATSLVLYDALYSVEPPPGTVATVGEIADRIRKAYKDAYFDFSLDDDGASMRHIRLRQPKAIAGLLVVLIGNAAKHSDKPRGRRECRVTCSPSESEVIWRISNPRQILDRRLELSGEKQTTPPTMEQVQESGFDKLLIESIIAQAFPHRVPNAVVIFPAAPDNGVVTVELRSEVANGA